jgi:hypothetical protein
LPDSTVNLVVENRDHEEGPNSHKNHSEKKYITQSQTVSGSDNDYSHKKLIFGYVPKKDFF